MFTRAHLVAVLILATGAGTAAAQAIYKCRTPDGSIAYQDHPCAGETLPTPVLLSPPRDPWLPQVADTKTSGAAGTETRSARPKPDLPPLPRLYRCVRENGSDYISADGKPPPRYVPAWVLGATSTHSNLPRSAARTRWDATVGGLYMAWQDRCVLLDHAALCAHWRTELRQGRTDAGRTFFAERAAAEADVESLRAQLRTHCGG